MNIFKSCLLFFLFLLFFLVACQGEPPPPELPAAEIIERSATRMQSLTGFRFIIDRTGGAAYLDPDETFSFRRAEGFYVAPNKAQANVRVIGPGLITEVGVISVGDIQWETDLLSAEWRQLPPNWGFNPTVLLDPQVGIQAILATELSELSLLDVETLEDIPEQSFYHITGTLQGEKIYDMSYQMIGPETMTVEAWIAPESFELYRAIISEPNRGTEQEASIWQVDFREFDTVVEIVPPAIEEE